MLTPIPSRVKVPHNIAVIDPLNHECESEMARPFKPDLIKKWKISLPATLAGTIEFYLFDRIHNKPLYGSRSALVEDLLEKWVAEQQAKQAAFEASVTPKEVNHA